MKPERYEHQQALLERNPNKYLLCWGCGCAKTRSSIELVEQKTFDVLVIVPKSLVANWNREIELWSNGKTVYSVMTKENFKKHVRTIRRHDAVIVDECFPAGTKVLTPDGYRNIEEIKTGDTIISAIGNDVVYHVGTRQCDEFIIINDKIKVTPEHLFFTQNGWVKAINLKKNDLLLHYYTGQSILGLNDKLFNVFKKEPEWFKEERVEILFKSLFNEIYVEDKEREDGSFFTEISRYSPRKSNRLKKTNVKGQSNEESVICEEDDKNIKENRSFSQKSWWKRKTINSTPRDIVEKIRKIFYGRTYYLYRKRLPTSSLQNRHSEYEGKDCNRNRRTITWFKKSTKGGQEEREETIGTRVESITFQKQRNITVYNLGVKNHPSYVVEDVLVHNCHFFSGMTSGMSKSLLWYLTAGAIEYVYLLTATPFLSKPWNVFRLAQMLGQKWSYQSFSNEFYNNVRMGGRMIPVLRKGTEQALAGYVRALGIPITMEEAVDVPENNYVTEYFELDKKQQKRVVECYDANPLVRFTKEHQINGGTLKGDDFTADEIFKCDKRERVLDLVDEHKKIMVVCRYNLEIDALKEELEKKDVPVYVIRGDVKDRDFVIQEARKKERCVLLVNASCSEGWEFPEITVMVFYSYDFSLKNYIQMVGRIQRINNIAKRTYLSLVVRGTVDEEIFNCIQRKEDFHIEIYRKVQTDKNHI